MSRAGGPLDSLVSGRFLGFRVSLRVAALCARRAPRAAGFRGFGAVFWGAGAAGAAPTAWTGAGRLAVVTGHRGHLEDFWELTSLVMTRKVSS